MNYKSEIPLLTQLALLNRSYPSSVSNIVPGGFDWTCDLQPTPNSSIYRIKISCRRNHVISVFVIKPRKLFIPDGEISLPHVFSTEKQQLCLFYKDEYQGRMRIVDTIVPWTSEWLFYYEIWCITRTWEGGGYHFNKDDRQPYRKPVS